MTELIQILIIAAVQGIGEFLPISSSGHNAVLNHLFDRFGDALADDNAEFVKLNVSLHLGTLLAVALVFRERILALFGKDRRLIPLLAVATLPVATIGLSVFMFFPNIQNCLPLISVCFALTGLLLLYTLRLPEGEKTTTTMTWKDALIIGLAQGFAVFPGISRLGITLVAGMYCRLHKEEAAVFSFLLSIPAILGFGLLQNIRVMHELPLQSANSIPSWLLCVGICVSCFVGVFVLLFFLNWLARGKLWYFAAWVFMMSLMTLLLSM